MAKERKDVPKVGERVRLRGRPFAGVLRKANPENNWAQVEWDRPDHPGPRFCHLYELERDPGE